jgi:hypothetical protein
LKRYKSPGSDQIKFQQNWLKQGVKYYVLISISWLILFGIRRICLISGRSLIIIPVLRKGDRTVCSNYRGISLPSTSYRILSGILCSRLSL